MEYALPDATYSVNRLNGLPSSVEALQVIRATEGLIDTLPVNFLARRLDSVFFQKKAFIRALARVCFNREDETEEAFRLMTSGLEKFDPLKVTEDLEKFPRWWSRIKLGAFSTKALQFAREQYADGIPSAAQNYQSVLSEHRATFMRKILSIEDFSELISLGRYVSDGKHGYLVLSGQAWQMDKEKCAEIIKTSVQDSPSSAACKKSIQAEALYVVGLNEAYLETWSRLKTGWNWEKAEQALDLVGTGFPSRVETQLVAAIEDNLRGAGDFLVPVGYRPNITSAHLLSLVRFGTWFDDRRKYEMREEDFPYLKNAIDDYDMELSYWDLPGPAIALIDKMATVLDEQGFRKLIMATHEQAAKQKGLANSWLLVLNHIMVKSANRESFVKNLVAGLRNLSPAVRGVFTDQIPGRSLVISPDGKEILTTRDDGESSEYIRTFYTSKAAETAQVSKKGTDAGSITSSEDVLTQTEKEKLPQKAELDLAVIGRVGVLEDLAVLEIVNGLVHEDQLALSADQLFESMIRLQKEDRNLSDRRVFVPGLSGNKETKALQNFGLSAVYQDEDKFYFVINNNGSVPLAFCGQLDREGVLKLDGTDETFIGDPRQIALNCLALQVANTNIYTFGVPDGFEDRMAIKAKVAQDDKVKKEAGHFVREYNRTNSARLSLDSPCKEVMLKLPQGTTILVGTV